MALYYSGAWAEHIYYLTVYLVIRLYIFHARRPSRAWLLSLRKRREIGGRELSSRHDLI
jgi:hypothetical protein